MLDRGDDPAALLGDRSGELHEGRQPAATRPHQPSVQQPLGGRRGESVDLPKLLLEQVGAVEPGVGVLDRGELRLLAVGEVLWVLPDREPSAFELAGELPVALAACLVPHFAADIVQRLCREHHDVERVHASDGVRDSFGDRPGDPHGHVGRDQFDLCAALFPELIKEREHRLAVAARGGPHQPAGVMVHHDGQVAMALAVRDLVDPDPPQPVKQIDLARRFGAGPLQDRADRPPRHAHQLGDRRLGAVHRQPADLVLECSGEPRVVPSPRDCTDHHAMAAAGDPRRVGLDERKRRPEIQCPPAPPALAKVNSRAIGADTPHTDPAPAIPRGPTRSPLLRCPDRRPPPPPVAAQAAAPIP